MGQIPYNFIKWKKVGKQYVNQEVFLYRSKRYKKTVVMPKGFISDGATGATDILSNAWGIHDVLKRTKVFDDGSKCSNWQASTVLFDILKSEGRNIRAPIWFTGTLLWGYTPDFIKALFRGFLK